MHLDKGLSEMMEYKWPNSSPKWGDETKVPAKKCNKPQGEKINKRKKKNNRKKIRQDPLQVEWTSSREEKGYRRVCIGPWAITIRHICKYIHIDMQACWQYIWKRFPNRNCGYDTNGTPRSSRTDNSGQ